MVTLPKPEVIITHESDLDGLISGVLLQRLAKKLHNYEPKLEAYHYDNWRQRPLREQNAWVCDFSFDERSDKAGWVVIDHHPFSCAPKNATLIHDLTKSTSLIVYEMCCEHNLGSPTLDKLVHLSNIADIFIEKDPDFVLASDYANLVKCYQFWNLYSLIEGQIERLLNHPLLEVMSVKRKVEDPLGYDWSKARVEKISPTVGYVDTVVGNNNLILFQLLENQATPFPVLMTLFRKGNGTIIVSIRSRNGEALKVAAKLQGGGHPNAAGATLPRSIQKIPDAIAYLQKVLDPTPQREVGLNSLDNLFDALNLK